MTDLAETYFRLAIRVERSDREKLKAILENVAQEATQNLFNQETKIVVTLREGTLKGWVKVIGGVYAAVAAYGSFRSGIDYLVHDAQKFSSAISSTIENSGISKSEILRMEKRTGVPGKVRRALSNVDAIRNAEGRLKGAGRNRLLDQARSDLSSALVQASVEDKVLIAENIPAEIQDELPQKIPTSYRSDGRAFIRPEDIETIERSLLRDVSKTRVTSVADAAAPPKKTLARTERIYRVRSAGNRLLLLPE